MSPITKQTAVLNNTGLQNSNPALYQLLQQLVNEVTSIVSSVIIDSSGITIASLDKSAAPINISKSGVFTVGSGQIVFPPTQIPSASYNVLDDFRQLTWTPSDGSGVTLAIVVNSAYYVKWGSNVIATFDVTYPVTGSGANAVITGLPWTSNKAGNYPGFVGFNNSTIAFNINVPANTKNIIPTTNAGVQVTNVQLTAKQIIGGVFYQAVA